MTIRGTTTIGGDLDYRSPQEAVIAEEAKIQGAINHERLQFETAREPTAAEKTLLFP